MRLSEVPRVYWIAGGAALAVTVGALVIARRASASSPEGPTVGSSGGGAPGPAPKLSRHMMLAATSAQLAGGGAAGSTKSDEETMKTPGIGYTTWFTLETEGEVISRLQAWRNRHMPPGKGCENLKIYDPMFGTTYFYGERQAGEAAQAVLDELYPTGRPWTPDPRDPFSPVYGLDQELVRILRINFDEVRDAPADWRKWLYLRVYYLALYHVCDYVPVI